MFSNHASLEQKLVLSRETECREWTGKFSERQHWNNIIWLLLVFFWGGCLQHKFHWRSGLALNSTHCVSCACMCIASTTYQALCTRISTVPVTRVSKNWKHLSSSDEARVQGYTLLIVTNAQLIIYIFMNLIKKWQYSFILCTLRTCVEPYQHLHKIMHAEVQSDTSK